jgi:GT2 family glycosyltransferase
MRKTRIIIVNYRTPGLVIDCLHSLNSEVLAQSDCRVTVVDNASGDGSVERIRTTIKAAGWTWAAVLPLKCNGGFASGNNAAIRPLLHQPDPPDYIHLLNPDTTIRPGAVTKLIDFLEAHPLVGIAGSRLEDPDGTPQSAAFRFHGILSELERGIRLGFVSRPLRRWMVAPPPSDKPHKTDWVSGASMMIRRTVFDHIGLMDENYFLYFEETDFCLRAARAGWSCWFVPESRVVHLEGQSTGMANLKQKARRLPDYWFDSRRRYFRKHHGAGYEFLANLTHTVAFALWRFRQWLYYKDDDDPPYYLRDFVDKALLK